MSQKRVALVLASLVGTMTLSAGALLLMEGGAMGTSPGAFAVYEPPTIRARVEVPGLKSEAWNYIIIYESGDLSASADSLAGGLQTGGSASPAMVRPKADFHFVIDRATDGRMDGELQVGTTWQNQVAGAPYAGWPDSRYYLIKPYNNAVGICLVADLTRAPVSEAQDHTLLQVVRELQQRLQIPTQRVLFQWDPQFGTRAPAPAEQSYAASFRAELEQAPL